MFRFLHWRSLIRRRRFERDMADEFTFHVQARTEDLIRSGVAREEAERRARIEFGGRERYRAECQASHRVDWIDELARNGRHALRDLWKSPVFSLTAVLSLALGLAAVGVIFAVVDTILLRPLPFAESERIVTLSQKVPLFGSSPTVVTADEFQRWQHSGLFESAALVDTAAFTLEGSGRPERIYGATVTPDFFRLFQLEPKLGREFSAGDATEEHSSVVILSDQLWARAFHSDPSITGKQIRLSGAPFTVIGVMPRGFDFPRLADVSTIMNWAPEQSEFWIPFVIGPKLIAEGNFNYYALGRLRRQVSAQRAAAHMRAVAVHLFKENETKYPQYRSAIEQMLGALVLYVTPLKDSMAWGIRDGLWMLFGAIGLLLVLVLFDLGNLLLTRNAHRAREYAVRQALGASRWQLFRQSFLEQSILVGIASSLAALLIFWSIGVLRSVAGSRLPRLYELRFSFADLLALSGLAFFTAVIFGALSQLLFSDAVPACGLSSQGRTATGDRRTNRWRFSFMVAEIAVALVLLVGAGLLVKSLQNVMQERPGFNPRNLLTVEVSFSPQNSEKPEKRLQHIRELLGRFRALPGVVSASLVNRLPLSGDAEIHNVQAIGKAMSQAAENVSAEYRVIDAEYFRTMQIPLISGRVLRPGDSDSLAIVNRTMANRLWPGEDPIGRRFRDGENQPFRVAGVVGDVHYGSLEKPVMMQFYRLFTASPYYSDRFVLRSAYDPEGLVQAVQKATWELDASEPVTHAQTMEHLFQAVTLPRRFETGLLGSFATVALFLAAVGLFGVASLSVSRKTREFGIRMAIGASGWQIVFSELMRTGAMIAAGLGLGLAFSIAVVRAMAGLLFGLTPWSPGIFLIAALVLIGPALLAGWIPAARAARIDPASALRIE